MGEKSGNHRDPQLSSLSMGRFHITSSWAHMYIYNEEMSVFPDPTVTYKSKRKPKPLQNSFNAIYSSDSDSIGSKLDSDLDGDFPIGDIEQSKIGEEYKCWHSCHS